MTGFCTPKAGPKSGGADSWSFISGTVLRVFHSHELNTNSLHSAMRFWLRKNIGHNILFRTCDSHHFPSFCLLIWKLEQISFADHLPSLNQD